MYFLIYLPWLCSDPIDEVVALATRLGKDDNLRIISLVEDRQATAAAAILRIACQRGWWVVIKNCHLILHWPADILDIFHVSSTERTFLYHLATPFCTPKLLL